MTQLWHLWHLWLADGKPCLFEEGSTRHVSFSAKSSEHSPFVFFLPFFSFSNSFPIPFVFSFFCRNVRSAWRAMLSGVSQSRRSWDGWPRRRIRNASKCTIPVYPSLSQSIHVGHVSHVSHVSWKRLVTCACSSPDVRQNGAGNVVNMGMMKCKCKYNMFCTSYKTLINVLYLLGITTECVELPLVWTMPFTWTFLRFSISTWTRPTRQWFCEYRSRTFIVLIWICCKDIVAQAPNSCVIQ